MKPLLLSWKKLINNMGLSTKKITKKYGKRLVVDNLSISLNKGEVVGLLGPNGAGKTTTFYMLIGLVKPDSGEIFLSNNNINKLPIYKRARKGLVYLPQEPSVFRKLTVQENIKLVLQIVYNNNKKINQKLDELITEFGLENVVNVRGDLLSGGERRRTEIARTVATNPEFILLDEPFAGIDPIAVEDIQAVIKKLKSKNIGVLITDHNVHETLNVTDRSYLLYDGKILKSGTSKELSNDDVAKRLYLGKNFELRT